MSDNLYEIDGWKYPHGKCSHGMSNFCEPCLKEHKKREEDSKIKNSSKYILICPDEEKPPKTADFI